MFNLLFHLIVLLSFGFPTANAETVSGSDYYQVEFCSSTIRIGQFNTTPVVSKVKSSKFSFSPFNTLARNFLFSVGVGIFSLKSLNSYTTSNFIISGAHIFVNLSLSRISA